MLAAPPHLARWCRRNADCGDDLGAAFLAAGLPSDLAASRRITRWAYQQAEATSAHVWLAKGEVEALEASVEDAAGDGGLRAAATLANVRAAVRDPP
jgi:hypothetical protein